ncbi:helix-turn-helix domain-containing protein [Enterococcus hulanensis]|uniref:Helix-turn-helix domain-containing protein n=1 Tax=Enterococcus hulanensis TaxID=2559929 RepID=A0ABU3F162_9ENTE|nr:helix-turn-helix domain-containing protein [Enterococcus hulanensis]MDT2600874.1 helix-turn-helix domain-containing protein [Enterococcus hulanensis]MDT2611462.1 helix-turn-helix domain-containing protein [Enterococcus hulanensis]MDT2618053.1 helix-turn-helix domain-containing protein [Enterococcus hulanensis]MDT2629056.1 helix-turn-helix domain-containing protein [Enterococcus hulanensis]MDT2656618.1 helix-turn-helix domain-containing protein [Enterococcus hulanensis]
MFRELFLTNQQRRKIQFFKLMEGFPEGEYSVNTLSHEFGWNYQPFLQLLREINDTLIELKEDPLLIAASKLYWKSNPERSNHFLVSLVKQSVSYRFIASSLLEPEKKISDFSKEIFVSESTILRRMRPLIDYLAECNIQLNFSKMELTGHEAVIRLFYIKAFWAASLGEDLVKSKLDFTAEDNLLRNLLELFPLHLHPKLIRLMLYVCRLRNDQKKYLNEAPFEDLLFSQTTPQLELYLSEILDSPVQIKRNVEFLNYLFYYYPYSVKKDTQALNPLMLYYAKNVEERDPLCLAIDSFYRYCARELLQDLLDEQEEKILLNNIARTFLGYSIQKKKIPLLFETGNKEQFLQSEIYLELYPAIKKAIHKLSRRRKLEWLAAVSESLARTLCLNLLPLFIANDEKIRVGLVSIPNYLYLQHVVKFLKNLNFIEIVFQPQPDEPIDLFITTFKELLPSQNSDYYMINILNADYKSDLLPRLLAIQNKKKFA